MRLISLRTGGSAALAGVLLLAACSANGGGGSSASPNSGGSASAAASASASAAASAGAATIQLAVAHTSAGDALTGEGGKTLYFFTKDSKGTSACTGDCATNWPPLMVQGGETVTAGDGVNASLIGSITRPDGSKQVSYGDHPLYYYAADSAAGDVNGQGKGGVWFIASPSGSLPSASPSEDATSSSRY